MPDLTGNASGIVSGADKDVASGLTLDRGARVVGHHQAAVLLTGPLQIFKLRRNKYRHPIRHCAVVDCQTSAGHERQSGCADRSFVCCSFSNFPEENVGLVLLEKQVPFIWVLFQPAAQAGHCEVFRGALTTLNQQPGNSGVGVAGFSGIPDPHRCAVR